MVKALDHLYLFKNGYGDQNDTKFTKNKQNSWKMHFEGVLKSLLKVVKVFWTRFM